MHRPTPRTGISAKIVKICDKTDEISARIGRTFRATAGIFDKTTETSEPTGRICDGTRGPFVRTDNNSGMMNVGEPTVDSSSRTGNRCGTTVTIFKAIVGISKVIARTGEAIGRISEAIDTTCIRIGRTCGLTGCTKAQMGKGSVVGINNGWATVDSARFPIRYKGKTRSVC
jgi:hypothetical protein